MCTVRTRYSSAQRRIRNTGKQCNIIKSMQGNVEKQNLHVLIKYGCFGWRKGTNTFALSFLSKKSVCPVLTAVKLFSSFTDLMTEVEGSKLLAEWKLLTEYQHESSIFFFTFAFTEV